MNLRLVAFCCTVLATLACIFWVDNISVPVLGAPHQIAMVERIFSGTVLTAVAALSMFTLLGAATIRGRMTDASRIWATACACSILAYLLNCLLKIFFGRLTPSNAAHNSVVDGFHLLQGDIHSSFPSGHMALAGAFIGVYLHYSPSSRLVLLPLFLVLGAVLVLGNWHYPSDVIAGGMLGLGIGLLAAGSCRLGTATPNKGRSDACRL